MALQKLHNWKPIHASVALSQVSSNHFGSFHKVVVGNGSVEHVVCNMSVRNVMHKVVEDAKWRVGAVDSLDGTGCERPFFGRVNSCVRGVVLEVSHSIEPLRENKEMSSKTSISDFVPTAYSLCCSRARPSHIRKRETLNCPQSDRKQSNTIPPHHLKRHIALSLWCF